MFDFLMSIAVGAAIVGVPIIMFTLIAVDRKSQTKRVFVKDAKYAAYGLLGLVSFSMAAAGVATVITT
ncbi:MAG: hypothetical protein R3194_05390 [Limnobacter sp.]|nr:hypothetical protein [Limnobacter sp.]